MLTSFETDDHLLEALRAGAVSFLLKDAPPEAVVAAVPDAAHARSSFSPSVLARLVALASASKQGCAPSPVLRVAPGYRCVTQSWLGGRGRSPSRSMLVSTATARAGAHWWVPRRCR